MKKRIAAIIATVMVLGMSVTAFANNIEPRSPTCPDCGSARVYNYRLYKQYPCVRCGKDGCGPRYYGWWCRSCNSFEPIEFMDYACE